MLQKLYILTSIKEIAINRGILILKRKRLECHLRISIIIIVCCSQLTNLIEAHIEMNNSCPKDVH